MSCCCGCGSPTGNGRVRCWHGCGGLCAIGLLFVLEITSGGAGLDVAGVLWATAAMIGAVGYFFISAKPHEDLPPSVLSAAGMIAAAAPVSWGRWA